MSFEQLTILYQPLLRKYAYKFRYLEEYEDLMQIGTIALWEACETYDESKGAFSAYAESCVRFTILDSFKKKRDKNIPMTEELLLILPAEEPSMIWNRHMWNELRNCLTEKQQAWLIGYYVQGKSIRQIATEMDTSPDAVKQWRVEALKRLRRNEEIFKYV